MKSWGNYCFICSKSTPLEQTLHSGITPTLSSVVKSSQQLVLKYLLGVSETDGNGVYKDVLSFCLTTPKPLLRFCGVCDKNAEKLLEMQFELEKVQMKMVDQLKSIKEAVIGNSRLYGTNLEVKKDFECLEKELDAMEELGKDFSLERKFLEILHRFQMSVFEKDDGQFYIPLGHLERYMGVGGLVTRDYSTTGNENSGKTETLEKDTVKTVKNGEMEGVPEIKVELEEDGFSNNEEDGCCNNEGELENSMAESNDEVTEDFSCEEVGDGSFVEEDGSDQNKSMEEIGTVASKFKTPSLKRKRKRAFPLEGDSGERETTTREKKEKVSKQEFNCKLCFFSSADDCLTWQHIKQHEQKIVGCSQDQISYHKCHQCKQEFRHKESLEWHLFHHTLSRQCDICNEPVIQVEMEDHLRDTHSTINVYTCEFCSFSFGTYLGLIVHQSYPMGYEINCQLCSDADDECTNPFTRKTYFLKHLYTSHGLTEVSLKCDHPDCTKEFFDPAMLKAHMNTHSNTYACPHCNKSLTSETYLKIHIQTIHEKNKIRKEFGTCELCPGKKFFGKYNLKRHMEKTHKESPATCVICQKVYKNELHLKMHMSRGKCADMDESKPKRSVKEVAKKYNIDPDTVDPTILQYLRKVYDHRNKNGSRTNTRFCCEQCPFKSCSECKIQQHINQHENTANDKPFGCPSCGLKFVSLQNLEYHLILKHSLTSKQKCDVCENVIRMEIIEDHLKAHGKIYKCEFCEFFCGTYKGLVLHMGAPKGTEVKCQLCLEDQGNSEPFVKKIDLVKHLHRSHGISDLLFKCDHPGCDKEYYNESQMQTHRIIHDKRHLCSICKKSFSYDTLLQKHIRVVHKKETLVKCDVCHEGFAYENQLKKHKMDVHGHDWEKFKCKVCPNKEYASRASLNEHMQDYHSGKPPPRWKCSICGRETANKKFTIAQHMRTHSDKNFTCEVCGFVTLTKNYLAAHMLQHGGEKKHKCSYCPRVFLAKKTWMCHEKTHTGEKPFQCDLCGEAFIQRGQLKRHNRTKHDRD